MTSISQLKRWKLAEEVKIAVLLLRSMFIVQRLIIRDANQQALDHENFSVVSRKRNGSAALIGELELNATGETKRCKGLWISLLQMDNYGFHDGNIYNLLESRCLDVRPDVDRSLQMHSSLIRRLSQERELEGCVNSIAWNSKGSFLISGSDDTQCQILLFKFSPRRREVHLYSSEYICCVIGRKKSGMRLKKMETVSCVTLL
ncbi:hypothetical protein NC653_006080 [Populus alba x Populus x berolinensis]|uniref:Uncharacterized protein n=1 Tax=Populus alba x Populus x berolinensis TaxID=444605 RepID=A0AAD6WDV6_9ROSI|nr:hypothetical protein NC653_006080 [Populus alba x Populus x berolinensis]